MKSKKDLQIISLNTWGGIVGRELLDFFEENKETDIFCLQEVYNGGQEEEKDVFKNSYKKNFNLLKDIKDKLPNFDYYFRPHVRDYYGLAIFVKKDLRIKEEGEFFVYQEKGYISPEHLGFHAKNIQYLKLQDRDINVINFHGIWTGKGKDDTEERIKQSENIVNFLKTLEGEIVLCGDFNLNPDTQSIKILENFGLRNLIRENNITSTRTSYYPKPGKFADYTFVSKDVDMESFKIMKDEVSDHAAMKIVVRI